MLDEFRTSILRPGAVARGSVSNAQTGIHTSFGRQTKNLIGSSDYSPQHRPSLNFYLAAPSPLAPIAFDGPSPPGTSFAKSVRDGRTQWALIYHADVVAVE